MLKKIPFDASIFEEDDASAFAVTMDEFVRAHVTLPAERPSSSRRHLEHGRA
jgi:hypothetical protein